MIPMFLTSSCIDYHTCLLWSPSRIAIIRIPVLHGLVMVCRSLSDVYLRGSASPTSSEALKPQRVRLCEQVTKGAPSKSKPHGIGLDINNIAMACVPIFVSLHSGVQQPFPAPPFPFNLAQQEKRQGIAWCAAPTPRFKASSVGGMQRCCIKPQQRPFTCHAGILHANHNKPLRHLYAYRCKLEVYLSTGD